jgi:hypothetical protein
LLPNEGLAGETCALADVANVGTAMSANKARAAISFFMRLLQVTDNRPWIAANSGRPTVSALQ